MHTTTEKINNVNAAARDLHHAIVVASEAIEGLLMMTDKVNVKELAGPDYNAVSLEATMDLVNDLAIDLKILGGIRNRAARLARMTNHAKTSTTITIVS